MAQTSDSLVFIVPVDYLFWTRDTYRHFQNINQRATKLEGIREKQLWLAGTLTAASREGLNELGWKVFENSDESLDWRELASKSGPKS